MGFRHVNGLNNTVEWTLKPENGTHSLKNLHFGNTTTDIVYDAATKKVHVTTNRPFTLIVTKKKYLVHQGETVI